MIRIVNLHRQEQTTNSPESISDLFKDPEHYLKDIPPHQRVNIFYELAETTASAGRDRNFQCQRVLAFDLDKINLEAADKYINLALAVLGLNEKDVAVINSGNGIHILVELETPIVSQEFFKLNKHHYKAIVKKINQAFAASSLPGKADPAIFDHARLLRCPGTINSKKGSETSCTVRFNNLHPVAFSLAVISGESEVATDEHLPRNILTYFEPDSKTVLAECDFLNWARSSQAEVSEPLWYKMLSVVARLENGERLCHEFSSDYPGYSEEETDIKITRALEDTGPSLCSSINQDWGKCGSCKHFGSGAIKSPIQITGENHVGSAKNGFYKVKINEKTGKPSLSPDFEGLRKHFKNESHYKSLIPSRHCYVWTKRNFYEVYSDMELENYANLKFKPEPSMFMRKEFVNLVTTHEVVRMQWFEDTAKNKTNFLNGYYDFDKNCFFPHTAESCKIGFRNVLDYNYNPTATCPTYDRFVTKATCGSKKLEQILDEIGGYAVSGCDYWITKAFMFVGAGANGKTTWLNALKSVVGSDNSSSASLHKMARDPYMSQLLDKKLVNVSEEEPVDTLRDTGVFKALTGGSELTVRAPYEKAYKFVNRAKLIATCNELPRGINDLSEGFFRRFMPIPFNQTFKKEADPEFDPHIGEKLAAERAGIFNRFLAGYKRLKAKGAFTHCPEVEELTTGFKRNVDPLMRWVEENLRLYPLGSDEGKSIPTETLHRTFMDAIRGEGERYEISLMQFAVRLAKLITDSDKRHKQIKLKDPSYSSGYVKKMAYLNCDIEPGYHLPD